MVVYDMKKLIKLIIDDEVFARMVTIVLKSSSFELIFADEDEPDAVILTDRADYISPIGAKVLYLLRHSVSFYTVHQQKHVGEPDESHPPRHQGSCDTRHLLLRPFAPEELLRAVAELSGDDESAKRASAGKLKSEPRLDKKNKRVMLGREPIALTEKEFLLFSLLYDAKGGIVTDSEIDEKVWKNETADGSNVTAVYVNYLRKKIDEPLGRRYILRVRGKGYRLSLAV